MRLGDLLDDLAPVHPDWADLKVGGITLDSRRVVPGDLYVAIVGGRFDGREFAAQAMAQGAVAVLGPAPAALTPWPWVLADAPRSLLAPLARRLYGAVEDDLQLIGVTGTNGKSTLVALVQTLLEAAGRPTAVLGTLGCHFAGRRYNEEVRRTTVEAPDLYRTLRTMRDAGAQAATMEVASHALALGRVDGLRFDVAAFTNLTRDHLDFHGDMESYYATKRQLFERLKPGGRAVIHVTDDWGRRLASEVPDALVVGIAEGDVRAEEVRLDLRGISARVVTPRGAFDLRSPLIGRYNLENLLTSVGIAEVLELPHATVAAALAGFQPLNGRLEPVAAGQAFPALVDFAHTPGGLEALLRSVRELTDRRIVLVFGCGGERDRGKRPLMGKVAGELADIPVITSDNPRREDPVQILVDVEKGLKESGNAAYRLMPDRREAIQRAVRVAVRGEANGEPCVVLLAGKGHEATQDLGDRVIPFVDREELAAAIATERTAGASGSGSQPAFVPTGERHG